MKVRCVDPGFRSFIHKDGIYQILKVADHYDETIYEIINDNGKSSWYYKNRFEIVKENGKEIKGEKEMEDKKREFNFVLPSIVAYKRSEWEKDLTRENPLIVTRIDGVTDFMIHDYIMDKARFLRIRLPDITNTDKDIAALTEWVKYVKASDWDDKKVNVKIVIPKI